MLVLFDLPTGSKKERKSYANFRKFLVKDGYHMEQFSVYSRVLLSRDSAETHLRRLKENLPKTGGNVQFLAHFDSGIASRQERRARPAPV